MLTGQKLHKMLIQTIAVLGVGLGLLSIGTVTANASSKGYYGSFQSRKITYHIDSKSKHWKDNWNGAVKAWNKLHVVKLRSDELSNQVQRFPIEHFRWSFPA